MKLFLLLFLGKMVATLSRLFNIGAGETWPGEIGLTLDRNLIKKLAAGVRRGVILVAGTNGKTTTSKMIKTILQELDSIRPELNSSVSEKNEQSEFLSGCRTREIPKQVRNDPKKIISNKSGANLLNGIASALINSSSWLGLLSADWAVFEVDEATLPLALQEFTPKVVVCLNLFRDQLDRYGEIDFIAEKWQRALQKLSSETTVVLNADDPQIAALGKNLKAKVLYFGLEDPNLYLTKIPHAADSIYCLSCGNKLNFQGVYFSHLGVWKCPNCGQKRPKPNLSRWEWLVPGVYNHYNILAAVLVARSLGVEDKKIKTALRDFRPAFGRGEEFEIEGKKVRILLSKNPTGFNATIRRVIERHQKVILLALNDRIPDGRDVSWIWDVDFEELIPHVRNIICSGERVYDLGLRLKYAFKTQNSKLKTQNYSGYTENPRQSRDNLKLKMIQELKQAILAALDYVKSNETLYILPTYSAMLEIRKILKGRKIL